MTGKSTKNIAASVRQQLLNQRKTTGMDYNALLTQYAIERFLYRLSQSKLSGKFILKGAMLFRVWFGTLHRPTKDLDLLGYGEPTPDAVADSVRKIIMTSVVDDGLLYDSDSVTATEIRESQEYGGIRVKLVAMLGKASIPMQIDVGFGDAVTPEIRNASFPTLLEQEAPQLRIYPPETVVAEKLETIVTLGMTNSRMKDYYDLLILFRTYDMDHADLCKAIVATFHRRQTSLPENLPPGLSDEFGNDGSAGRLWHGFLRRLQLKDVPADFFDVVVQTREQAWGLIVKARQINEP